MNKTKKSDNLPQLVSPELTKSLEVINSLKPQVDEIGNCLLQIQIVDESTLMVCQQNLSKANSILNSIEEKRKESKAPIIAAGKLIDSTVASLTEIITNGIAHAKSQVANYEKERMAKAKEEADKLALKAKEEADKITAEEARKKSITDYIQQSLIPYLQSSYEGLKTSKECDIFLENIKTKFPGVEKFQEYLQEANTIRDNYVSLIEAKKSQLQASDNISDAERAILKEKADLAIQKQQLAAKELELKQKEEEVKAERERKEAEERAKIEAEKLQAQSELDKTKNIRFLWKFELADIETVPLEWLTLDESKVKEWMKANKGSMKEETINGVRFYKEISVVA